MLSEVGTEEDTNVAPEPEANNVFNPSAQSPAPVVAVQINWSFFFWKFATN